MGVPVITLAGKNFCGHMGVSILNNAELGELVAETNDQYVAIALSLAEDKQRRLAMRSALRKQIIASPLYDNETYVRELEKIYQRIRESYCDNALSQQ